MNPEPGPPGTTRTHRRAKRAFVAIVRRLELSFVSIDAGLVFPLFRPTDDEPDHEPLRASVWSRESDDVVVEGAGSSGCVVAERLNAQGRAPKT